MLADGRQFDLRRLRHYFPYNTLLKSDVHLLVCKMIATRNERYRDDDSRAVYINCLSQKSDLVKLLSALAILHRAYGVTRIESSRIGADMRPLFGDETEFSTDTSTEAFLSRGMLLRLMVKWFLHRLYRLFRKWRIRDDVIIKTSVDINEVMFREEFGRGCVLIYPFHLNLSRGLRYIVHCFNEYPTVSLAGVPYRLTPLLAALVRGDARDERVVEFEVTARRQHAKELLETGVEEYYCSDDFEVAAIVLNRCLIKAGVSVVNKTHGIGCYCPLQAYTRFDVFNIFQRDYYRSRNPDLNIVVDNYHTRNLAAPRPGGRFEPAIVFIDNGDFGPKYGLYYEHRLQDEMMQVCSETARTLGIPFFIKFHPNRARSQVPKILKTLAGSREIESFDSRADMNPIMVNVYSTSFFDFYDKGPMIFVQTDLFDPSIYFGEKIEKATLDALEGKIGEYCDENRWYAYYDRDRLNPRDETATNAQSDKLS